MSHIAKPRRAKRKNYEAAAAAEAAITGESPASSSSTALSLSDFALKPVDKAAKVPRKPGTVKFPKAIQHAVVLGTGRSEQFVQRQDLPQSIVPGQSALMTLLGARSKDGTRVKMSLDNDTRDLVTPMDLDDAFYAEVAPCDPNRHRLRRAKQATTWQTIVVPLLVQALLQQQHGTSVPQPPRLCACAAVRTMSVVLCDIDGTSLNSFQVCPCRPAAPRLVAEGYFPCAPTRPSVAFSLRLLELISVHSLNVAPNVTAWAATLETFWGRRGFTIAEKRVFRTRLGNALHWYQIVVNQRDAAVSRAIFDVRQKLSRKRRAESDTATATAGPTQKRVRFLLPEDDQNTERGDHNEEPASHGKQTMHVVMAGDDDPSENEVHGDGVPLDADPPTSGTSSEQESDTHAGTRDYDSRRRPAEGRPAEYLRERCPLCFGGPRPVLQHTGSHVIVCLDANFSQKRRRSSYTDPPLNYQNSRFVDPRDVDRMEKEVEAKRGKVSKKRKKGTSAKLHDDVLDECERSFLAAQEKVTKASKNYYSDTGLMAILCRHDQVLYVVNMSTPGERQHYALALLREVFYALPPDWSVGVLYDIACQLSRSIEKHDFLPEFADRMTFGVSVFHAYGHQWACQLVFHPRKRDGFGLTDSEGCERFWSALRSLIACLRVSGYHRRLFILDRQIEHVDAQNLYKMGKWLARRWSLATRRLNDAALRLELINVPEEVLAAQWKDQLKTQLASAPRQSKYAGDKAVESILLDLARIEELRDETRQARKDMNSKAHKIPAREVQALRDKVDDGRAEAKRLGERVALAKAQLGTGALRAFEELRGDAYIRARVNARALRVNIRMGVRAHKFEREKLERSYRRQVMQNKDHAQTRDLVHSREKGISAMVRKFNTIVTQMEILLKTSPGTRRDKRAPRRLDAKKLFRLDVDDDIWQEDPGLGPQDEGDLPRWQVDSDVREGIIVMLERQRCQEEQERLTAEAQALLHWWLEERKVLLEFSETAPDPSFRAAGKLRLAQLDEFAAVWNRELARTELGIMFPVQHALRDATHVWNNVVVAPVSGSQVSPSPEYESTAVGGEMPQADGEDSAVAQVGEDVADRASDTDSDTWTDASSADDESPDEDDPDAPLLDLVTAADADDAVNDGDDDDAALGGDGHDGSLLEKETGAAFGLTVEDTDSEENETDTVLGWEPQQPSPVKIVQLPPTIEDGSSAQCPVDVDMFVGDSSKALSHARSSTKKLAPAVNGEYGRVCGPYECIGEDVARMAQRTEWLSGQGLAVFAEGQRAAADVPTVGHLPSSVFLDVDEFVQARDAGDQKQMAVEKGYIAAKLQHVPTISMSTKWLVVVHIIQPEHWTLLEIRWDAREFRFYDSLAARDSYDVRVKKLAFEFLALCEELHKCTLDISQWTWIGEMRRARQTNWYDCGPFVAADLVSLLSSDMPSTKSQEDMRAWRRSMVEFMRKLDPLPSKVVKRKK